MIAEFNQCRECKHFKRWKCTAFLSGIPVEIAQDGHDHRQPYPGDNGIRFEPLPGRRHPLELLKEATDGREKPSP
jgi:hypothetical protein